MNRPSFKWQYILHPAQRRLFGHKGGQYWDAPGLGTKATVVFTVHKLSGHGIAVLGYSSRIF